MPYVVPSFGLLSRCKERNRFGHLWSVQPLIKFILGAVEPPPFPIDTSNIKHYFLIIQTFSKLFLIFFYLPCVMY